MNADAARTAPHDPARICRWFGGKKAALSLRFDDAHPTHIEKAVPMLNERGLIGTLLVNPGNSSYLDRKDIWEGAVIQQGHELGDHTMNHHGASTDREADEQIGKAAEIIRGVQPEGGMVTFGPGGATMWLQRKPFAFFDAKYHLFDLNAPAFRGRNVMSCSESYSFFSVDAFTRRLERAIADGDWFRPHFHQIGEGHLYISPEVFGEVLDVARAHDAEVWQAGINAIQQYEREQSRSRVWASLDREDSLTLHLTCGTDYDLYTQPLTVEVDLPAGVSTPALTAADGTTVPSRVEQADGRSVLRFEAAPTDATYSLRGAGIADVYRREYGLGLRAPGPHPYLLFDAGDVPALLAKTSDPVAREMWEHIIRDADGYADEEPSAPADNRAKRRQSGQFRILSLTYALTHDDKYARAAARRLERYAADDSWHERNSEMLVTASAICTMGLAYDWMHDALTEDQRALIRKAIITHGIEPILESFEDDAWWTRWYRCNWGAVIYGQAGIAALSLLPDEPRAADWVRLSQRQIWHYVQALGDDGGWGESGTYGAYAWGNAVLFMDASRRVSGFDLFDDPKLRLLPYWFINLLDPTGESYIPFADCGRGNADTAEVLFRLGSEYRDGRAQYVGRQMIERRGWPEIFAFLWYDPTLEPKPVTDLPLDKVFPDLDWAVLRSRWEDPEAVVFAVKGGQEDWDHHHHDIGSFALYAYGRPLLVDYFYPHTLWGCEAESHNLIVVNGKDQRGHVKVAGAGGNPDFRGVVAGVVSTPGYARLVNDASLAYEQSDVNSCVREAMYLRRAKDSDPPDYFVLFDDVDATHPSRMDWLFHTYGKIELDDDNVTITQDDAALDITLVAPGELRSEVYERDIEEAGVGKPFDSAQALRFLKTWPRRLTDRGYLVSVLAPRRAAESSTLDVAPIREENILGVTVTAGEIVDVSLFALDAPEMAAHGIEAVGRSCFVRRSGGRVLRAALHSGQRLSADGAVLFETNSWGQAVVTFGDDAIDVTLDLYDSSWSRVHVPERPAKVLVNGEETDIEYDAEQHTVTLSGRTREARIILR